MTAITQSKRLALDFIIAIALLGFYFSGIYTRIPGPAQLITLKGVLVSLGFLHAHITGKLCFGEVKWTGEFTPKVLLRIALYVVFIYAYSTGG